MCKTQIGQMFCHKNGENRVQERARIRNLGSITPISDIYERRSIISPLLFAFPGKQRPPRSDRSVFTKNKKRAAQAKDTHTHTHPNKPEKNSSSTLINDKAFSEHVSGSGCAKWRQQDNNPAARRAPSSVYLMESVRCGAVEDAVISPAPIKPACLFACLPQTLLISTTEGTVLSLLSVRPSASAEFTDGEIKGLCDAVTMQKCRNINIQIECNNAHCICHFKHGLIVMQSFLWLFHNNIIITIIIPDSLLE